MTEQEAQALVRQLKPLRFEDNSPPCLPPDEVTAEVAEALLVRVVRIWLPERSPTKKMDCRHNRSQFFFRSPLSSDIDFSFARNEGGEHNAYIATGGIPFLRFAQISTLFPEPKFGIPTSYKSEIATRIKPLANEWFPFFRRGCWLSGLAIEASGHEKVEWMQGFSREELEAWDLKM